MKFKRVVGEGLGWRRVRRGHVRRRWGMHRREGQRRMVCWVYWGVYSGGVLYWVYWVYWAYWVYLMYRVYLMYWLYWM